MNNSKLVRGALLVALALALQSLRLVLPMPQLLSTFIIGTLVHMMLVLTLQLNGLKTALLLAFLIPVIWLGNFIFVLLVRQFKGRRKLSLLMPPLAKAIVMLLAAWVVVSFLALPNPALRKTVMFAMSVPQLLTAVAGILLAEQVKKRLRQFY